MVRLCPTFIELRARLCQGAQGRGEEERRRKEKDPSQQTAPSSHPRNKFNLSPPSLLCLFEPHLLSSWFAQDLQSCRARRHEAWETCSPAVQHLTQVRASSQAERHEGFTESGPQGQQRRECCRMRCVGRVFTIHTLTDSFSPY